MNKNIIIAKGILQFDPINRTKKHDRQGSWKKTAMILLNDDTCEYYRYLIQRKYQLIQGRKSNVNWLNPPLRGTHVTIINDRTDDIDTWKKLKEKYDNTEIYFFYNIEDGLRNNGSHIYYKVDCPMGDLIREEGNLGDPYFGYHLTIGQVPDDSIPRKEHIERVQKYMIDGY
tara:strand:- start:76856 stop:77371 length:516 start_codon:yes stop_codon:yes gene_type:complete